jgi:hypothetical protein
MGENHLTQDGGDTGNAPQCTAPEDEYLPPNRPKAMENVVLKMT